MDNESSDGNFNPALFHAFDSVDSTMSLIGRIVSVLDYFPKRADRNGYVLAAIQRAYMLGMQDAERIRKDKARAYLRRLNHENRSSKPGL